VTTQSGLPRPSATQPTAAGKAGAWRRLGRLARPACSLVAFGLVVWWISRQPEPRFPTGPRAVGLLALALALYAAATAARGERWHRLLRRRRMDVRRGDAYGLTTVGYMGNNLLPARAGDVLRVYLLAGRVDMGKREGLGTALAERVLDAVALIGLFGIATVAMLGQGRSLHERSVLISTAALAGAGLLGAAVLSVVLHHRHGSARARRLLIPLLASTRDLVSGLGMRLLALSLLIWLLEASVYLAVGQALSLPVGIGVAIYVMAFANLAGLVPAGPGYVGTYDAAVLLAAGAFAVRGGPAVAYLVLLRFALFLPITLVGLVILAIRYAGWRSVRLRLRDREAGAHT
jgi:uncharacterized membrane protein YbhN (UPF0104 family)